MATLSLNNSWRAVEQAGEIIRERGEFANNGKSLRGYPGFAQSFGRLPDVFRASAATAEYTIVSYSTPIAWLVEGSWIIPDVRYSVTTSKHMGRARMAIHHADCGAVMVVRG